MKLKMGGGGGGGGEQGPGSGVGGESSEAQEEVSLAREEKRPSGGAGWKGGKWKERCRRIPSQKAGVMR